jgi:caa(3)-type oxidase subunit IV
MTDMTHEEHEAHVHPPYMKVFAVLAALTLIELVVPTLIGGVVWLAVLVLVAIAIWKMKLIMGHFMHLQYDARILVVIAAAPAVLALILVSAFLMEYT